jgi:hypothetical protein
MTARNSLTHMRSTHTDVEDNSKHIRKNMLILCEENVFSPYGPCAPSTTDIPFRYNLDYV